MFPLHRPRLNPANSRIRDLEARAVGVAAGIAAELAARDRVTKPVRAPSRAFNRLKLRPMSRRLLIKCTFQSSAPTSQLQEQLQPLQFRSFCPANRFQNMAVLPQPKRASLPCKHRLARGTSLNPPR